MGYLNLRTMERSKGCIPFDPMPQNAKPQTETVQQQVYNVGQDSSISMPENVILQTKNYGMFKLDPLNRALRHDKLDRLYDAVQAKNLLHLFPIIVTRGFVVIDGQHRLAIAEKLDTPIYYIVSSQMQIEDAAQVNMNVTKWTSMDYMNHWCKMGITDYIWFKEFWAANPFLTFTSALSLAAAGKISPYRGKSINAAHVFYAGKFQLGNTNFAVTVANMTHDFSRWVPFWKDTKFVFALQNLAENPEYDHRRMMQKMEYLSVRLVRCADTSDYLKVFEQLYNHQARPGTRVHFVAINKLSKDSKTSRKNQEE